MKEVKIIKLVGSPDGKEVEFDQNNHVLLSDGYYYKRDKENVVSIDGRYYRKNSPLVVELSGYYYGKSSYGLLAECIEDFFTGEYIRYQDRQQIPKGSLVCVDVDNILEVGDDNVSTFNNGRGDQVTTIYKKEVRSVMISEKYLNEMDSAGRLAYGRHGWTGIYLLRDCVHLHPSYPRGNRYIPIFSPMFGGGKAETSIGNKSVESAIASEIIFSIDGNNHLSADISWSYDDKGQKYKPIANSRIGITIDQRVCPFSESISLTPYARDIVRSLLSSKTTSPRRALLNQILVKKTLTERNRLDSDFKSEVIKSELGISVGNTEDLGLLESLLDVIKQIGGELDVKSIMNKCTWFLDKTEEIIPCLFTDSSIGNQGGDYVYSQGKRNVSGKSFDGTGGIKYSFGVELETERGVLPIELAIKSGLDCVGDRSIGSIEYVTGVLSGDEGLSFLGDSVDQISKYALVSDSCGLHVHVGSDGSFNFDKKFAVLSVMLGCSIEKELFSLLPDNRMSFVNSNGMPYCGSILQYEDMSLKSWKKLLFHYVYGRNPEERSEEFGTLCSMVEDRHRVGRWGVGRYKWLNLINCTTDNSTRRNGGGGFQTIEFRAFNGTLNFQDVKAFLLFSLAFTKFVADPSNEKKISSKDVRLMDIVNSSLNEDCSQELRDMSSY